MVGANVKAVEQDVKELTTPFTEFQSEVFTASANQTVFELQDNSEYTSIQVFVNGLKQKQSNYTYVDTTLTLSEGVQEDDEVEVVKLVNTVSKVSRLTAITLIEKTIDEDFTIPTNYNALSVAPTVNSTVTVSENSTWGVLPENQ